MVGTFTRVVVPLDGSERARAALRPAATVARGSGASLTLLSAVTNITDRTIVEDELEADARTDADDLLVETCVRSIGDSAGQAIVNEAETDGALVCLTSHGHGGVGRLALGSVAADVVRLSSAPVLVIGPAVDALRTPLDGPIVTCLDGSDEAEVVLAVTSAWSSTFDLPLWFVRVVEPAAIAGLEPRSARLDVVEGGYLAHVAGRLSTESGWELLHGPDPARAIDRCADRLPASMIAMATHGRTGTRHAGIGSVALQVVHHAPCPVLLVPPAFSADVPGDTSAPTTAVEHPERM